MKRDRGPELPAPTASGTTSRALVCFPLKEEAAPFRKIAAAQPGVQILLTGIGRENSQRRVSEAIARQAPGLVLTCGFAGGLRPDLALGTVLFQTETPGLASALATAGAVAARFHCAQRIAVTAAEKQQLRQATGADAVEMESECIHELCRRQGIPCATVRVISDTATEDMPLDFNALSRPDRSLDYGKLAWAIARAPQRIAGLLRLQKNCQGAAQRLAAVLETILR
jgi:adenosylhomocysteine nucleosidase